jgi:hypothetical protein
MAWQLAMLAEPAHGGHRVQTVDTASEGPVRRDVQHDVVAVELEERPSPDLACAVTHAGRGLTIGSERSAPTTRMSWVTGLIDRRGRLALMIAATLLIGAACTNGDGDGADRSPNPTSTSRAGAGGDGGRLRLLDEPAWQLTDAVDYRAGLGALEERDPDLDWYAEYDGQRADNPDGSYTFPHVATFGHTAGLDARRSQLPGFEHRSAVVDGRQALVSRATDGRPAIVVIELASDYTATLLTYDLGVDLSELAEQLVAVDDQQWIEAGGSLLDCVPFEAGCSGQR